MLLTITTTHRPATDLGYLLHKHPGKLQEFSLSFGRALVFYPEAAPQRCTAALLLEVDPVALVRSRRGPAGEGGTLDQYVNDRPYVASSFLSVAIAEVYGTALSGKCAARPELAAAPLPLSASLDVVPCRRGGEGFLRKLFEPLGYAVEASRLPLDEEFPEWGGSPYFAVTFRAEVRLRDLSHIYVLVPVLDDDKHYWVGDDEVSKLLREKAFEEIVGLDVSSRALEIASSRLRLDTLPERQRARVKLLHGSLLYRDRRLAGYDAAAVVEVIEHLDPPRLRAFERAVFEFAAPRAVVVTTPNVEYNARFADLPAGRFRHRDHRFEWTREELRAWASRIAAAFGYAVRFAPVGPEDLELGPPTQMAIFTKEPGAP